MQIKKWLYTEYNENHFKLYCPVPELWLFVNVYAKSKKRPVILDWLFKHYTNQWMSTKEAWIKAAWVVRDFFTVCKDIEFPFKLSINVLDFNLYKPYGNNRKKVPLHQCIAWQEQPKQWDKDLQIESEDKLSLRSWVWTEQICWTKDDTVLISDSLRSDNMWEWWEIPNPTKPRRKRTKKILSNSD